MKKLIVANWKLNPSSYKEAVKLAGQIDKRAKHKVVVCPPHVYLSAIHYPLVGAQDCFWEDKGPHTGQVSPTQLKNLKVKYCIVGHSERREVGDNDLMVNAKLKALQSQNITPILCVGFGTTADEDDLAVVDVLKGQLDSDLHNVDVSKIVVAYEPVWAISHGDPYAMTKHPTPEHAEKISLFIKTRYKIPFVLYGGSVNAFNAKGYLDQENVDGLLVGGDSLIPKHFNQIINL